MQKVLEHEKLPILIEIVHSNLNFDLIRENNCSHTPNLQPHPAQRSLSKGTWGREGGREGGSNQWSTDADTILFSIYSAVLESGHSDPVIMDVGYVQP